MALATGLLILTGFLEVLLSCKKQKLPQHAEGALIDYETDNQDSLEWQLEAASLTQAMTDPKARLTIEYLNNETELFRPSNYRVRLWYFGNTEPAHADRSTIDALGDQKYDSPDLTITKNFNGRSYTRRTVPTGWYIAEFDTEGIFYKFNASVGSDGLMVYNEHDTDAPMLSGYYASYGTIKLSFDQQTVPETQAFLTLTQGSEFQRFWLYATDATGKSKSVSWFMPVGVYAADWFKSGGAHKSGTVTISAGKQYPILKL